MNFYAMCLTIYFKQTSGLSTPVDTPFIVEYGTILPTGVTV